ncbi:MAG: hypothetical protein ACRDWS_10170 [Acidimicrobiia bacterium]
MAVETRGTVQMRGEPGRRVAVEVLAEGPRLSLLSGAELIGEWDVGSIGIQSLHDGFAIRAEGEEFVLKTEDDVGLALEIGLGAASPRMARRVAASQNPEARVTPEPDPAETRSNLGAIGLALGGVLVLAGGFFLRDDPTLSFADRTATEGLGAAGNFWFAFVIGGVLMVGAAFVLATRAPWSRAVATLVVSALVIVFGMAAQNATPDPDHLLAYGFIAGGVVVGLAILFAGNLGDRD